MRRARSHGKRGAITEFSRRSRGRLLRLVAPTLACYLAATTGGDVNEMFQNFSDMSREGLKRLDKLKEQIARGNGADIEDVLHWFDAPAVEF